MSDDSCDCDHDVADLATEACELFENGEIDDAERVCRHALKHMAGDPRVLALMGWIACERLAHSEAVAWFEEAMRVDPRYAAALIDMAVVYLERLEDYEKCLSTCERAMPLTSDSPELLIEVLCCKAMALKELGNEVEARAVLSETIGLEVSDTAVLDTLCSTAVSIDAWDVAGSAASATLRLDPDNIEAMYRLGWIHATLGEIDKARPFWLRTLEHDLSQPRPNWHLSVDEFDSVAESTLLELPERARLLLRDVPIVVEDAPSVAEVEDGLEPRALGVFCGPSRGERSHMEPASLEPNVIKLYQRNLEAACESRNELVQEIRMTLLHETAHFFGLEDEQLEQIGLG